MLWRSYSWSPLGLLLLVVFVAGIPRPASALIMGGRGNDPVKDPGWPEGAETIFNHKGRIAYWVADGIEGWHSDCRGDAKALSAVLADYAKLEVKPKRVVLHNGLGNSYVLNPTRLKKPDAWIQWSFMVQQTPAARKRGRAPRLGPVGGPPVNLDVYCGGELKWEDVIVPKDLFVVDKRLEAHGFTLKDGIVLEGKITNLSTDQPVVGKVQVQRVELLPKGARDYSVVLEKKTDDKGHWVVKQTPAGLIRVVIFAEGYMPRVVAYERFHDGPSYFNLPGSLAPAAAVSGLVQDAKGAPLSAVRVSLSDVVSVSGDRYESPEDYIAMTNKKGEFRIEPVPVGEASVQVTRDGYIRPGPEQPISMPVGGITLVMLQSADVEVTVDFTNKKRPIEYRVEIAPAGREKVGSYGGSAYIDANDVKVFKSVPPGRYVVHGHPNPSAPHQKTDPVLVELKGGEVAKIKLFAK